MLVSDTDELNLVKCRQAMVMIIAFQASLCLEEIGKDRLSDRVMQAMATVPRHRFVPVELQEQAYDDLALPIGFGKTISQPFMVALMTDLLAIEEQDKVLEVGTGLGYQAAILTELAKQVFSVEIIEELAREGELRLRATGCPNVQLRIGDGSQGWVEHAPFDKIMVTSAPKPERAAQTVRNVPTLRRMAQFNHSYSQVVRIRFRHFPVSFSFPMISRSRVKASAALPLRHRITRSSA
jgi:protein-L-isoaspartate(D-aspartate) O-methyltransferase